MEFSTILTIAVIGLVLFFMFRNSGRVFLRGVAIVLILSIAYILYTGKSVGALIRPSVEAVFDNKTIFELHEKYCDKDRFDKPVCQCIVTPIYEELYDSHSKSEIEELKKDKVALRRATLKAADRSTTRINTCMKEVGSEKIKVVEKMDEWVGGRGKNATAEEESKDKEK